MRTYILQRLFGLRAAQQAIDARLGIANALQCLGDALLQQSTPLKAQDYYQQALKGSQARLATQAVGSEAMKRRALTENLRIVFDGPAHHLDLPRRHRRGQRFYPASANTRTGGPGAHPNAMNLLVAQTFCPSLKGRGG